MSDSEAAPQHCPKCEARLRHLERDGLIFEVCSKCEGTWLDPGELTMMLGLYRKIDPKKGKPTSLVCIRCKASLVELTYPRTEVQVDWCPECMGVWLDEGELEQLQENAQGIIQRFNPNQADRAAALLADMRTARDDMLSCPKCSTRLNHIKKGGNLLEYCNKCKGIWFDPGELTGLIGVYRKLDASQGRPTEVPCLRCRDVKVVELTYPNTDILIDLCPECDGLWLDEGELDGLKADLATQIESPASSSFHERIKALGIDQEISDAAPPAEEGCPEDGGKLATVNVDGVKVERCAQCQGIWCDTGELTILLGVSRRIKTRGGTPSPLKCFKCPHHEPMVQVEYPKTSIKIDICPDCRGTWLSPATLQSLRTALN